MRPLSGTEPPAASGQVRAAPPVGRDADLAALRAVVERARAGEPGPRLAVLRGDPGVGKSTLLRAVGAWAAGGGGTVLAGRADDLDRRTPYAMFADALRPEADAAPPGRVDRLADPLEALGELDASSPSLAGQLPALVAERVAGLLRPRGRRGLCVLTLDDLHAADDDSLAALASLVRRLPSAGCIVLAALRARPPELPVPLAALLERLAEEGSATFHELGPLAADDAAELAARWLGAAPDAALAAGLWEWCRGNPFYLRQAIRSLEEAGALLRSAAGVSLASATRPTLTATSLVRLRLARLGGTAERTARVLAAFGAVEVHDLAEVAELTGHPVGVAERTFDLLVAAGFLDRSPDGRFSFSHPIVRDTLHAELGPAERRRLHGAMAARLLARRDAGTPVPVMELAHHLAESAAPGDRRTVAVLAEAGVSAIPQAPHAAARWLRRALELLPPGDAGRGELLLRLARALYLAAGVDDELVAVGRQAVEALPAGPDRDWVSAVTVAGLGLQRRPREALAVADRALAGHDHPMPSVLAEKARMLIHLGRPDEAVALAQRVFELGAEQRIPMVAVGTLVDIAAYGGQVAQAEALFTTALALTGPDPTPDRLGVLCRWAVRLASYGELARAQAMIREAEALHQRFGGAIAPCGANLRAARTIVAWLLGRWGEVLHEAARPPDGQFVIDEITLLLAAEVHLERGATASAAAIVERLGAQPAFPLLGAWVAAGVAVGNDAQDAARQLLGAAVDAAAQARLWGHAHLPLLRLVELEHAAGNAEAAWRRLATLEWAAAQADIPLANVLALRARGLLAADPAPLRRALAIADEHGLAVQAALARSQLGCLGESPAEHLPAAIAAFRAFGAERRRRRAAAELRARGLPVPRQPRLPRGMLTDTEVRLARYVADGLTNREIADTMSLSAGTVATYLVRVFAKTGTANRRALGQAVRRGALDHARA
jgi:DNA-binding NarL/FixJ family response regulator